MFVLVFGALWEATGRQVSGLFGDSLGLPVSFSGPSEFPGCFLEVGADEGPSFFEAEFSIIDPSLIFDLSSIFDFPWREDGPDREQQMDVTAFPNRVPSCHIIGRFSAQSWEYHLVRVVR